VLLAVPQQTYTARRPVDVAEFDVLNVFHGSNGFMERIIIIIVILNLRVAHGHIVAALVAAVVKNVAPTRTTNTLVVRWKFVHNYSIIMAIQRLSHVDHVLKRPDMYIGAISSLETTDYLPEERDSFHLTRQHVSFNNCIVKMFDELLVNARDHSVRDPTVASIKVQITEESFAVENDGACVPIEIDPVEGIHVPELVFGHLLTSSNYNDDEERIVGGRNGLGAKLANIFANKFVVHLSDGNRTYKQTFTENMKKAGKPSIKEIRGKLVGKSYTRIQVYPDWTRVGATHIDPGTRDMMIRRAIDVAATARPSVKVNNKTVGIKTIKQFAKAILHDKTPVVIHETDRWKVAIFVHEDAPRIGLVNGVSTPHGTHMQYILGQVVKHVRTALSPKKIQATPSMVAESIGMIVDATIINPTFSNQQKDTLTTPLTKFGSSCPLPDELLRRITNKGFGLVERLEALTSSKADAAASKIDALALKRRLSIPKLDDATLAGTSRSGECTLILTEGDSAKTLAISGLAVVGRQTYGVFPLRGKLLNVRDKPATDTSNAEIQNVKRILGLEHKKKYTDVSMLRYGKVMIMTDADDDGAHIKGLILNFFDTQFPELLSVPGFVAEFVTPIIKAKKGQQTQSFFSVGDYNRWAKETPDSSTWTTKYYKGLGTSTSTEAREYFSSLPKHTITFTDDEHRREALSLAFSKKRADDRKRWIQSYDPDTQRPYDVETFKISDFIHKDLICFSRADVIRSIPSAIDGLKPSQRKVIFASLVRRLDSDMKVAQLAGFVAEKAAYHHGETSLQSTIVGLARDYVGSNNIPFLVPSGQFGTRICGGNDAASARYIFTRLSPVTRILFPAADDAVLTYLRDDGQSIEPDHYCPLLPAVLLNGAMGIGTGFSTFVPCYKPLDILENIERRLRGESLLPMTPWYRGFRGEIRQTDAGFTSVGVMTRTGRRIHVTELPIGVWTQQYKEYLLSNESISKVVDESTEAHVDVTFECTDSTADETTLKLVSRIPTTNMVLFDSHGTVRRYDSVLEIIEDFFEARMDMYAKRKAYQLDDIQRTLHTLRNKLVFVKAVVDGRLIIVNRDDDEIKRNMDALGLHDSEHLLNMRMRSLTRSNVDQLDMSVREAENAHVKMSSMSAGDLWSADLQTLRRVLL